MAAAPMFHIAHELGTTSDGVTHILEPRAPFDAVLPKPLTHLLDRAPVLSR